MVDILKAIFENQTVGELRYDRKKDQVAFQYDAEWASQPSAFPLSLAMPLTRPVHPDTVVRPFISGLLPDNDAILKEWGRQFQVSPRNPFKLIQHVGEECAGAIQFVRPGLEDHDIPEGVDWISESDLTDRISALVADHAATRRPGDRGHFSLAGAQPKIGLFHSGKENKWGIPKGKTPTTHIVKPSTGGFSDYDLNEHFCLVLAKQLGLPSAKSWTTTFGETPAIVVERYDRLALGDSIVRLHQEDTCQALGISPHLKYQKDGGSSAADIFSLTRDNSTKPREDTARFLDALIFNWLIMGTDAHGKNYSFLHGTGSQVRLARLYDLSSFHPYQRPTEYRKTKLAMKIGGTYQYSRIGTRQWEKAATEWRIDKNTVFERITELARALPEAAVRTRQHILENGSPPSSVIDLLIERSTSKAKQVASEFS